MQLKKVKIHNLRSIKETDFNLMKLSLLIGENNAGKTNIITALRIFYEDGIKYDDKIDFPKFQTDDKESWIELEFITSSDEQASLKKEYQSNDKILKVRKYLRSEKPELVKQGQSNIYAYENNTLSTNLFYGAKNISQAKLGSLVFIPELSKTEDSVKMSGPSPLRDMINFVMKKVIKSSQTFTSLQEAFNTFNIQFKEEASKDGFSLTNLVDDINQNIKDWGIEFEIQINAIAPEDIVKNLVSHQLKDCALNNQPVSLTCYGQGLQRHLIYTLIRLSAKYVDKNTEKKKEWSPDYTLILFEEPEAFLHPTQQEILNLSLNELASGSTQQILITTHSPIFVSRNVEQLPSLLKVSKNIGQTEIFQIDEVELSGLYDANNGLFAYFTGKLKDPSISEEIKKKITDKHLGATSENKKRKIEEESIKYFLWLDSERTASFFAKHVIICEGACEKILLDYLFNTVWRELKGKHLYCLDAMGKYNIHRYMNLFDRLGISHSVLYDKDADFDIQGIVNTFLEDNKNRNTKALHSFDNNLEQFLGIANGSTPPHTKPLNIMWHYLNSKINKSKIDELKEIITTLI